jgi:hypothetical protein
LLSCNNFLLGAIKMRPLLIVITLLFSIVTQATTVTIDFEDVAGVGQSSPFPATLYTQDYALEHSTPPPGYESSFPAYVGSSDYGNPPAPDGGEVLNFCADAFCGYDSSNSPAFTLSHSSNIAFDLFSVDFSNNYSGLELYVTGFYSGGGTVQASVMADGINWQTLTFGSEWTGLDRVEFLTPVSTEIVGNSAAIDNIVVSAVPVPAAVWLFGSALAGLGWMRRKQAV